MNTLFIDTTAGALVVSPVNPARCLPPRLVIGDTIPITLAFLQRNPQPINTGTPIYNYIDESAAGIMLVLGRSGMAPTSGGLILSFGANSTSSIPFNVSSYFLTSILNSLQSVIAAGGVTVSGNIGGPFTIRFITNGARSLFTSSANSLSPASSISILTAQAGTSVNTASQVISWQQNALAQVVLWVPQAAAIVTVTSIQADVIQRVAIPSGTYGGSFTLTYNSNTTVAIPFDAQLDLVAYAINALPGVTGATVVPGQNYWDITIPGGSHALTGNAAGLLIPLSLTGTLDLSPQSISDFLSGAPNADIPVFIQSTNPSIHTIFSGTLTLNAGISGLSSAIPIPAIPGIVPRPDIDGITGTSNPLDGTVTANGAIFLGEIFILTLTVGGLKGGQSWQLVANPGVSDGITTQRPLDYNASTNNVGWIRIS